MRHSGAPPRFRALVAEAVRIAGSRAALAEQAHIVGLFDCECQCKRIGVEAGPRIGHGRRMTAVGQLDHVEQTRHGDRSLSMKFLVGGPVVVAATDSSLNAFRKGLDVLA